MPMTRREFLEWAGRAGIVVPLAGSAAGCELDSGTAGAIGDGDGAADAVADRMADLPPEVGPDAAPDAAPDGDADGGLDAEAEAEIEEPLPEYEYEGEPGPEHLFEHGVASGDPLPDAVILWTRVSAGPPAGSEGRGERSPAAVDVFWEVAAEPTFAEPVAAGWAIADPERDHTVKVEPTGLAAGTAYFYRFRSMDRTSPVGRTRTAPVGGVDRLRFGVCACSNFTRGWFHGYREMAEMPDLDAIVHLGDYIYEGGENVLRAHDPPHELLTLGDYRRRYSQYRRDPDLREAHRQHPFIPIWDDHESANNAWRTGAENHTPGVEGDWSQRKVDAIRAWHEWQPVRDAPDRRIYRTLRFGDLVDLVMIDTRLQGRSEQAERGEHAIVEDPERTILGMEQEAWLAEQLAASEARWTVLGNQVMLGQLQFTGSAVNPDQWDGYEGSRQRLYDALEAADPDNFLVLTGDVHSSWAIDLIRDPQDGSYDPTTGAGARGVELVVPGVTSPFPKSYAGLIDIARSANDHIQWSDVEHRGYMILDVTPERAQGAWRHFTDVTDPDAVSHLGRVMSTRDGAGHVEVDTEPARPPAGAPPPAP